jgi:hypothetical protein
MDEITTTNLIMQHQKAIDLIQEILRLQQKRIEALEEDLTTTRKQNNLTREY